jgi:hypothetical protein
MLLPKPITLLAMPNDKSNISFANKPPNPLPGIRHRQPTELPRRSQRWHDAAPHDRAQQNRDAAEEILLISKCLFKFRAGNANGWTTVQTVSRTFRGKFATAAASAMLRNHQSAPGLIANIRAFTSEVVAI